MSGCAAPWPTLDVPSQGRYPKPGKRKGSRVETCVLACNCSRVWHALRPGSRPSLTQPRFLAACRLQLRFARFRKRRKSSGPRVPPLLVPLRPARPRLTRPARPGDSWSRPALLLMLLGWSKAAPSWPPCVLDCGWVWTVGRSPGPAAAAGAGRSPSWRPPSRRRGPWPRAGAVERLKRQRAPPLGLGAARSPGRRVGVAGSRRPWQPMRLRARRARISRMATRMPNTWADRARDERLAGPGEKLGEGEGVAGVAAQGRGLRRVEVGGRRSCRSAGRSSWSGSRRGRGRRRRSRAAASATGRPRAPSTAAGSAGRAATRGRGRAVTVWAGTSWVKATRKAICSETVPAMVVRLWARRQRGRHTGRGGGVEREGGERGKRGAQREHARPAVVPRQGEEQDHEAEAQQVRQQRCDQQELGVLARRPGALEVAAALRQGEEGDGQREDVALDKRGGHKGPRVYQRELGDEVEVGDDDDGLGRPLPVAGWRPRAPTAARAPPARCA